MGGANMADVSANTTETPLQLHKRVVYGKLVDKTLSDVDYVELSELAYGHPYSSDVARRMFYGSMRTLQLLENDLVEQAKGSSEILSDIDLKLVELRKERQKLSDQRREYNKLLSNEARKEHISDKLLEAANNLSETIGVIYPEDRNFPASNDYTEAVLVFSDWHYGMKTSNVFNRFDKDVCLDRIKTVAVKAAEKIQLHNCRCLHVVVLGDLIHGAIHTSARVASEELVCDQLMEVSEILAQTIENLSSYVEQTRVYVTYGNHARTIQSKNDSIHRDNLERLVPWWLTQRLSGCGNVEVISDNGTEFIVFSTCGHTICATHGDNDYVRSAHRSLPPIIKSGFGESVEYILLGDKHHRESFEGDGITSLLCGSLCGTDDYANNKRLYSTPSQLLLITNDEDGVDAEYRIKCN